MKILVYGGLAGPGPVAGGVWRVAQIQADLLRGAGHDVHLYGLWLGSPSSADADHPHTHLLPARPPFPGARYRALWTRRLWQNVAEHGPYEIAHLHLARDYASTTLLLRCHRHGIPCVVQTHGMLTQSPKASTRLFDSVFRRRYLESAQTWLALTADEVVDLKNYGAPLERIRQIHNPVPASGVKWNLEQPWTFLFASRLHPRKQADVFVKAGLRALGQAPEMRFVIAGPDEGHRNTIERLIAQSGHSERFEVLGPVTQETIRGHLASSLAMVLPSRAEIAPMIAIESAEIGTPMILTSDSGLSDGLRAADAALVVEPTVQEVGDAMLRIWQDPSLRYELSRRSQEYYGTQWATAGVLADLEDVYRVCMAPGRQTR